MKNLNLFRLVAIVIFAVSAFTSVEAQVVRTFNYQGVVLDDDGSPIANESVSVTVTIPPSTVSTTTSAVTSSLGAFSVQIEVPFDEKFDELTNYEVNTSVTTSKGTVTTSAPLSVVPMAIFAEKAAGIAGVDVLDESPTNEIQTLTIVGNQLSISGDGGNTVNLPTGGGTGDGDNDPNNEIQTWDEVDGKPAGFADNVDDVNDADSDPNNEIQSWSEIPGVPPAFVDGIDNVDDADADPENELQNWGNLPGIPADLADGVDNVDDADADPENEIQVLTIDGTTLSLNNGGGSVIIPSGGTDADADPTNEIQTLDAVNDGTNIELYLTDPAGNVQTVVVPDNKDDADADPENEIQTLDAVNDGTNIELYLTDQAGNVQTVIVPDLKDDADADPQNELQNWSNLPGIPTDFADGTDDVDDADADPNNEIQLLALNGTTLSITGGNEVIIPGGGPDADADPTNELQDLSSNSIGDDRTIFISSGLSTTIDVADADADTSNELQDLSSTVNGSNRIINISSGTSTTIDINDADADATNEFQNLSLIGTTLSLSDGNDVDLSGIGGSSLWGSSGGTEIFYTGGNVGIGTATPTDELQVAGSIKIGTNFGNKFTALDSYTLELDGSLRPNLDNLEPIGHSSKRYTSLWASDGTINTSDRREKKNIKTLDYGLADVMNLKPVAFEWINGRSNKINLGFIAQDLQTTLPEVVVDEDSYRDEEGNIHYEPSVRLGVKYADIIPVTVKAIQEQQATILSQNERIEKLENELELIKALLLKSR